MNTLAVFIGTLMGAALKECAPVLGSVISKAVKEALTDVMEEGQASPELKARLAAKLK